MNSGNNSQSAHSREKYKVGITLKCYPDGGRVLTAYPLASCGQDSSKSLVHQDARSERAAREERSDGISEPDPEQPLELRSGFRSAARCKDAARAAGLVRMATLTFPESVHSYDRAYRLLSGWLHRQGREYFPDYIAVPELHPGGHGWHWHLLHRKRLDPRKLFAFRESWTRHLLDQGLCLPHGCSWVIVHLKHFRNARSAGQYAAKYVSKALGMGLPPGRQRYLRSEGLDRPAVKLLRARCLDDVASALKAAGWTVLDGREKGWGTFIWATTDPPFDRTSPFR